MFYKCIVHLGNLIRTLIPMHANTLLSRTQFDKFRQINTQVFREMLTTTAQKIRQVVCRGLLVMKIKYMDGIQLVKTNSESLIQLFTCCLCKSKLANSKHNLWDINAACLYITVYNDVTKVVKVAAIST